MERLTEKSKYGYRAKDGDYKFATQKLGKLEDIEEELGISLEVLFNALKEGIYARLEDDEIRNCNAELHFRYGVGEYVIYGVCAEDIEDDCFVWDAVLLPKDYGKTWALTREELE